MAQKITIELVDDIDGSSAEETVSFGLDGKEYEIDLSNDNASKLRAALADFVNAGRSVKKSAKAKPKSVNSGDSVDPKAIRAWAKTKGIDVPDRGRVPGDVREKYLAENG